MAPIPNSFVFANNKGGVGKSTLSTNTAAAYAKMHPDETVLFVDLTFTRSVSRILLGDNSGEVPPSMNIVLDQLASVRNQRELAKEGAKYALLFTLVVSWLLELAFKQAAMAAAIVVGTAIVYYFSRQSSSVDPLKEATQSTIYKNLYVLVGGKKLSTRDFPWETARYDFHVPKNVKAVFVDVDNTLDDYARFAFSMCSCLVVPSSTSTNDFERLCDDPRNGSLFEFLEEMPSGSKPVRYAVILNRIRMPMSAADNQAKEYLLREFEKTGRFGSRPNCEVMRELAGSLVSSMKAEGKPIVSLQKGDKKVMGDAVEDIKKIVDMMTDAVK